MTANGGSSQRRKPPVDDLSDYVERRLRESWPHVCNGSDPTDCFWEQVARVAVDAVLDRQRTPRCEDCDEPIVFVPRSGFGNTGEWQHRGTPARPGHLPRPRVFIDPPKAVTTDGFLGC